MSADRRAEIAAGLSLVRERIAAAAQEAGRREDEVTLIVVSKKFPATDIDLLAELGVTDIGENKEQELSAKLPDVAARDRLTVHFIGQLQSNKARAVAQHVDVVQSVDRVKLLGALDRGRAEVGRPLHVLLQVSLDDDAPGRGGAAPDTLPGLVDALTVHEWLRLRGVMGVAPRGGDPDAAFARLREVSHGIRKDHPEATWISAGMSGDLESAVRHGATHLRVGTAILGSRLSLG
jgi:pyridoxal phosphate enzyme (YggS family)